MSIPARILNLLEKNNVPYELLRHPPAFTAQELAAMEHVPGRDHVKVVVVRADGEILLAVVPSNYRIDLAKLSRITGKPTELVSEDEFDRLFPDCSRGAMPPFGRLYDLATYVDRSLAQEERIVFEAGTHTDAVRMTYEDFARLAKPRVEVFAEKLH
ncbi:MAG TPA: YbaK/EbsC family protein [Candidatus Eisenbacteria bacterium]